MPKTAKKPSYLLHAPSGQARVRIAGRDHYLGEYGSAESKQRYDDLVADWLIKNNDTAKYALSINDLCLLFMQHADQYYRRQDGTLTGETDSLRHALRFLIKCHGRTPARSFGPLKLKEVRESMIRGGMCRTNINRQVHRVKRVFAWGVENELVPVTVYQALQAVQGLRAGRTAARESDPVQPVADDVIEATLPHLPRIVADMVRLQLLTGARPKEVCTIRPSDVTLGVDGIWIYRPAMHKTQHRGRERRIFIGPAGQALLKPYLNRDPDSYCFSPADAESERNATKRANRKSPMTPSQQTRKPKGQRFQPRYTKDSYNRCVQRGCEIAFGIPVELRKIPAKTNAADKAKLRDQAAAWRKEHCWSPAQLRHSRATEIRERYGIEAAQTVLGHADPKVTEIYAEKDWQKAAQIMREIG